MKGSELERESCFSCGAEVPKSDGPVHKYMDSSPGCWAAFGEVLAREYSDFRYAKNHRLTVDAYALQHPGKRSRQTTRSVAIHMMRLYLVLERGVSLSDATNAIQRLTGNNGRLRWLEPPQNLGSVTVADVHEAGSAGDHVAKAREWAESAWSAWRVHHGTIRGWTADFM